MTSNGKCGNYKSNSSVAAAELVCLQPDMLVCSKIFGHASEK